MNFQAERNNTAFGQLAHNWHLWILGLCLILAIGFQSRAFTLGYFAAFGLAQYIRCRAERRKIILSLFVLSFLVLSVILVFFIKTDSSKGRLFVYKITSRILEDHFPAGIGTGNFGYVFGTYQLNYFKEGDYSEKELLLADNTVHAYNDYLQFIVEQGVFGLVVLAFFVLIVVFLSVKAFKSWPGKPALLVLAVSQLTAMGVAAFFSPVIEKSLWQCLFILSFAVLVYYAGISKLKYIIPFTLCLIITVNVFHYGNRIGYRNQIAMYAEAKEMEKAGFVKEADRLYGLAYDALQDDTKFLRDYIGNLQTLKKYPEALKLSKTLAGKENISMNYKLLGDAYYHMKMLQESEEAYRNAVYRVPNRFGARYDLYNFYVRTGQAQKAEETALGILALPVKVPSIQVDQIKKVVREQMTKREEIKGKK